MRRCLAIGVVIVLALAILTPLSLAKNAKDKGREERAERLYQIAPTVAISSPENLAIVIEDALDVVVSFTASAEAGKGEPPPPTGNVRLLTLQLDGSEVARYKNPAHIKEGDHTFTINLANIKWGQHSLQAFAYQADERAGLKGESDKVYFSKALLIPVTDPVDLAVDKDRMLYILQSFLSRVSIYDQEGNFQTFIELQAYNPKGIALDKEGNLYLADTGNNRIQKLKREDSDDFNFTIDNSFGTDGTVGSEGIEDGQFHQPWAIAVDDDGNIYVTDTENNRVQKFDTTGKFLGKWGAPGSEPGQFAQPKGIFIDNYGYLHVVDSQNNRIQEFSRSGSLWSLWGEEGQDEGQFSIPSDIAIDNYYAYVVNTGNNRLQRFGQETYQFLLQIDNLNLSAPQAIAIDADLKRELIYIADTGNGRILKVEIPIIPPERTWNKMKEALEEGDIEVALETFTEESKERYREFFTAFADDLSEIAQIIKNHDLELIYIKGPKAKYRIRSLDGNLEVTYYVYFIKDEDGDWKISTF